MWTLFGKMLVTLFKEVAKLRFSVLQPKLIQPSIHRWTGVAIMRLKGRALPAVDLVQVGKVFFVIDGHHRISVAKALGEEFIEANVLVSNINFQTKIEVNWNHIHL
jgi:hypothetical protein